VEAPAMTDFHRARVVQGAPEAGPSPHYKEQGEYPRL